MTPEARRVGTSGLAEVVIPPRSGLSWATGLPGHGHRQRRPGRPGRAARGRGPGPGETVLAVGDTLLLQGTWKALDEHLDGPGRARGGRAGAGPPAGRAPWAQGSRETVAVLGAMVVLLATGVVPSVVAGLLAAGAMVLLRRGHDGGAYRADLLDDGRPRGRDDPAVHGDAGDRRGDLVADALVGVVGGVRALRAARSACSC